MVRQLKPTVKVLKNSCILTKTGISTVDDMEEYLEWATRLGIQKVVFRELSQFSSDEYIENFTFRWNTANRSPIEPLLTEIAPSLENMREGWEYTHSTVGYYYFNEHFCFRGGIDVIIEVSSYDVWWNRFKEYENVVDKLVFHFSGELCKGWYSDKKDSVLAKYISEGKASATSPSCGDRSLAW